MISLYLMVIISVVSSLTLHDFYSYGEDSGDRSDFTVNGYAAVELSGFAITNFKLVPSVSFDQIKLSLFTGQLFITSTLFTRQTFGILISPLANEVEYEGIPNGQYFYRLETDNTTLFNEINQDIKQSTVTQPGFIPSHLVIATWVNFNGTQQIPGNSFQITVATDGNSTYAIILIADIKNVPINPLVFLGIFDNWKYRSIATFPFSKNVSQAPYLSLGSDVPGTYILKLSNDKFLTV